MLSKRPLHFISFTLLHSKIAKLCVANKLLPIKVKLSEIKSPSRFVFNQLLGTNSSTNETPHLIIIITSHPFNKPKTELSKCSTCVHKYCGFTRRSLQSLVLRLVISFTPSERSPCGSIGTL